MTEMQTALEKIESSVESCNVPVVAGFQNKDGFELMLRQAKWLSSSDLLPQSFRGNIANTVIALEIANRMSASPLAVMQNLYIVHGKPGWSAQFIIAAINSTGKFSPLRFAMDNGTCVAWAIEKATGERLESPPVSMEMAKKEGWFDKSGSKWKTMPELMLRYRAATFFGRLYAPDVLMGMRTTEEIEDAVDAEFTEPSNGDVAAKTEIQKEKLKGKLKAKKEPRELPEADGVYDVSPVADPLPTEDRGVPCPNMEEGETALASYCKESCASYKGCPTWA